jgi:hypothetical protein
VPNHCKRATGVYHRFCSSNSCKMSLVVSLLLNSSLEAPSRRYLKKTKTTDRQKPGKIMLPSIAYY